MAETERKWETVRGSDGNVLFEGYTGEETPYCTGILFAADGTIFQEGIFDEGGLRCGREYYPNGAVKFEGTLKLYEGDEFNTPEYGRVYDDDGSLVFEGFMEELLLPHYLHGYGGPA